MDYGVGISNRYAFLDDDVEDDVRLQPEPEKVKSLSGDKKKDGKIDKAKPALIQGQKSKKPDASTSELNPRGAEGNVSSRGRGGLSSRGRGGSRPSGSDGFGQEDRDKENYGTGTSARGARGGFSSRGRGGGRGRGGYGGGGGGGGNNFARNHDEEDYSMESRDSNRDGGANFTRGGRGGGRGMGRGGFTRRRDFDRLSGSDKGGVKSVDKREGAGAHNWGTYKDEIEDADNNVQNDNTDVRTGTDDENKNILESGQGDADLNGQENENTNDGEVTQELEVPEEPKLLTLEQWKALQQPRATPEFNIRKPNEGEDPSKWKNLVLKKKENLDDDEYEEGEEIWVPQRSGRQKLIKDIGFHFEDERNERNFRRGGFRKRNDEDGKSTENGVGGGGGTSTGFESRGRGGGYGRGFRRTHAGNDQQKQQRIPKVDDIRDFPGLIC